jgi:hypothetical protein
MADLLMALDAPPSGRSRATWFDSLAYCRAKLMSYGPVPWDSPGEVAAFFGKAQGMFRSDALLVDLGDLLAWRVGHDGLLRTAMAARSRPGYALRTLLGDEQARAVAAEAVTAVAASAGAVPVVLSAPSPARWLAVAAAQAGAGAGPGAGTGADAGAGPPDPDLAETAAMYTADFLRTFAGLGVDGLLLDEGPASAGELIHPEAYRPVLNVADHYGWPVLISAGSAPPWPFGEVTGVAAWLGSDPETPENPKTPKNPGQAAGRWGIVASTEFWHGTDPPAAADLVLAAVPADADPDTVMQRVRALSAEP